MAIDEASELNYSPSEYHPYHGYDVHKGIKWANEHGYMPDERGHRDDAVKKFAHPTHPDRGTWNGDYFELSDLGMETPNYT